MREPPALWEEALEGQTTDLLADQIVEAAVRWAEGNKGRLLLAEHILATSPYLGGEQ